MSGEIDLEAFEAGAFDLCAFDHRDHLRMGFELARRAPFTEAANRFAAALRQITARTGQPERYHDTITVAFMALIAERLGEDRDQPFEAFERANPDLFDRKVLTRWYDEARLNSAAARRAFVLPGGERPA